MSPRLARGNRKANMSQVDRKFDQRVKYIPMELNKWLKISRKTSGIILICLGLLSQAICVAQNIPDKKQGPQAQIEGNTSAEIEKNVIFDASKSILPGDPAKAVYRWDFGDGTQKEGVNVAHTFNKTGTYRVRLEINADKQTLKDDTDIFIYKKSILLLTDQSEKRSQIENLKIIGQNEGIEMNILESFDSASEFISEEALTKAMDENPEVLNRSDEIILWTNDNVGLNTLSRFIKDDKEEKSRILSNKNLYVIDDDINKFLLSPSIELLAPKQIIVAKEASLYVIIPSMENNIVKMLQQGGYEFKFIDEASRRLSIGNFMTYFVNFLVESGIPDNTIVLILMLPIIATIIVFMRQVVGMNTFGMYTPLIICLTFLILGLKFGMITFMTALVVGMGTRYALKRFHLLFTPKLAIVMIKITLSLFALLIIGTSLKLFDSQFFSLAIFPMLILASITEKFTGIQSEAGFWKTLWLTGQTIIISVIAYIAVGGEFDLGFLSFRWDFLRNFMRHYPESIFLFLLINIVLGRWTGLRLVEYFRFREIFQHNEEE